MPDLEVSRGFASIPTPGGIIANPGEWRVNGFYYSAVVLIIDMAQLMLNINLLQRTYANC